MAEKKSLVERLILFVFFIVFAGTVVAIAMNWGILDDRDSENVTSFQYQTTSKNEYVDNTSSVDENVTKLVNINTATVEELDSLPGIGEVKAKAIVEYRETFGLFHTVDELTKVSGIAKSTMEKLRPYVTVE